ncbi:hypothetical protein ACRQ5Q_24285 [Bradyrhizobium sp. PMVTL-01]|uniref:hypothetical protein n=1 Tax=Bradyrhizobium sp. PMVTL-01 TaxID=3434999 RepID=UPI003F720ED6
MLRAIHGDESVKDVEPGPAIRRSHRDERARLIEVYGGAKDEAGKHIVAGMFPGVAARVHETLEELGLPDEFFKATGRMKASPGAQIRHDGPTVSEWVAAGYFAENYPPDGYAPKSTQEEIDEAIAKQKAAREALAQKFGGDQQSEGPDEDGVEDMDDDIADQHSQNDGKSAEDNILG